MAIWSGNVGLMSGLVVVAWVASALAFGSPPALGPILQADPSYDERTIIAPSKIPGAGNGLYARVRIKEGEIIGELGGHFVEEPDLENPSAYLAGLPDCVLNRLAPYRYLDSKERGGHVSRINFAPRTINGKETHFQNAAIQRVCYAPYIVFVALRDIEPGTEMLASYGPSYGYARFMNVAEVRDYFCGLVGLDCRQTYDYEH